MPNRKISELTLATSSLPTDGLVIQRAGENFKLEASNFSTDTGDTGSLVTTSSISGTTITFTKGDGSTYTNEIVSASYAITSSHEVVHEESSSYAETSSYAVSASLAQLALEAISSSYAISASHAEVSDEAISASYAITASHASSTAGTLSNGTSVDAFSFDGSTDVTVDISTYSASVSTDRTALSASLTTTDQTISSSVATLSGSASDARNQLSTDYIAADTTLSASLTTTDQIISGSVATLSGSASTARNTIAADLTSVSSSASTERVKYVKEVQSVGDNLISVTKGDGTVGNITIVTSSFVKSVNGNGPDGAGNVAVALASTSTGLSSSFPTSPDDADVYIITGETATDRTASNGELFIYSTASSQWYQITSPDQTANDERYVLVSGDTMTGKLIASQGASSDEGINITADSGVSPSLGFLQSGVAQSFLIQETASPYALKYTTSDKSTLRNIQVATPTVDTHAATKLYVDSRATTGTNGQTIRFNGTTPTANSLIFNNGTDVGIGTTSPQAHLHVQDGGDTTVRIGRGDLTPDRDFMEIISVSDSGSIVNTNEHLRIQAASGGGTSDLMLEANNNIYLKGSSVSSNANLTIANSAPILILNDNSGTSVSVVEFQQGGVRRGFVGDFGGADDDIGIAAQNTNGNIVLSPSGTGVIRVETINTTNPVRITNVATPTAAQDAATKNYVDGRTSVMQFQKTNIQTTSGRTTISFASTPLFTTGISFGTMATTGVFTFSVAGTYRVDIATNTSGTHDDWGLVNNTGTRYLQYAGSGATKYSIGGDFITVSVGDNFRYTAGGGQTWNGNNTQVTTRIAFTRVSS